MVPRSPALGVHRANALLRAPAMGRAVEANEGSMTRPARARWQPDGYLGSNRIATAPEPNSSRLTSFRSTCFDSPANNVGP